MKTKEQSLLAKPSCGTRKALTIQGMQSSISARKKAGLDLKSPANIDSLCKAYDITVRFNNINMEGMYEKSPKPRIHISALRPLARRTFTCMHELGHHVFNHGSTIDELREDLANNQDRPPEEIIADSFASYTLMPTLGIRNAFHIRSLDPETATASDYYAIACNFGVGQSTLVNHVCYQLQMISREKRDCLGKITPKKIRNQLLGIDLPDTLVYVDQFWNAPTLDTEIGTLLLFPHSVIIDTKMLKPEGTLSTGRLFRAVKTGITRVIISGSECATFVRIARRQYIGLAHFRHMEDEDE